MRKCIYQYCNAVFYAKTSGVIYFNNCDLLLSFTKSE